MTNIMQATISMQMYLLEWKVFWFEFHWSSFSDDSIERLGVDQAIIA